MSSINLVAILIVAAIVPLVLGLLPWLPVPAAVIELLVGVALGPSLLGWVEIDTTVEALAALGLAFLLFLAGWEVDLRRYAGRLGRAVGVGLLGSMLLATLVWQVLDRTSVGTGALLVAIGLLATSLGLVVPLLKDTGLIEGDVGRLALAGGSAGEIAAVVLLSVGFGEGSGGVGSRLVLLGLLGALLAVIAGVFLAAERWQHLTALISRLGDTTAQIRIRLTMVLVAGLALSADRLGFEAILGAFLAGVLLRLVDPSLEAMHPHYPVKVEALGFGFLIPVFFVSSGVLLDLSGILEDPGVLALAGLFFVLLLLVRALPALAYQGLVGRRQALGVGLLQATSLPFLLAVGRIGTESGALGSEEAAALVCAGLVSVLVLPALAGRLLEDWSAVPTQTASPAP